jgi:fructooligosaccharide transport system substrate-binding protein
MTKEKQIPKYKIIQEYLKKEIQNGIYQSSELIPSEKALMNKFNVSKSTVTQALNNLVIEGLIYREQGKGSFVNPSITREDNLSFWMINTSEGENSLWNKICNDFNNSQTDIHVQLKLISEHRPMAVRDMLYQALAEGKAPDIISIDGPDVPYWAYIKAIRPLDGYMTEQEKDRFIPSVIRQGSYQGRLYHLGYSESSMCIVYNKEIFNKLNINVPSTLNNAWTWGEFKAVCAEIKVNTNLIPFVMGEGRGISLDKGEWTTYSGLPFLWQNGAYPFNQEGTHTEGYLNSPNAVNAMDWVQKLFTNQYTHIDSIKNAFPEKSAMSLSIQTNIIDLWDRFPSLNLGVMPLPYNKKMATPHGGWGLTITTQSKSPDKAWQFIKYVFTLGNQLKMARVTGIPVLKEVYEIYSEINKKNEGFQIIFDQLEHTSTTRPSTPAYPKFSSEFAKAFFNIAKGEDPQVILNQAVKEIDQDIRDHGDYKIVD